MTRAIAWFARNHVAANLLMALMIIGGVVSLPVIQQRAFPEIEVDVSASNVVYLGAARKKSNKASASGSRRRSTASTASRRSRAPPPRAPAA